MIVTESDTVLVKARRCEANGSIVFRQTSGLVDSRFPGAAAGSSWRLPGHQAGGSEPADLRAASARHRQGPGRHQPHPERVGPQDQVDVSPEQEHDGCVRICLTIFFHKLSFYVILIFLQSNLCRFVLQCSFCLSASH